MIQHLGRDKESQINNTGVPSRKNGIENEKGGLPQSKNQDGDPICITL